GAGVEPAGEATRPQPGAVAPAPLPSTAGVPTSMQPNAPTQTLTFPVPIPVSERPFRSDLIVLPADHLLGDWWGVRTRLEARGISPTLTFVSHLAANPVSAIR